LVVKVHFLVSLAQIVCCYDFALKLYVIILHTAYEVPKLKDVNLTKMLVDLCSGGRQVYRFSQVVYKTVRPSIVSTENLFHLKYLYSVCKHF